MSDTKEVTKRTNNLILPRQWYVLKSCEKTGNNVASVMLFQWQQKKSYDTDLRIESFIKEKYVSPSQLGCQYIEREQVPTGITLRTNETCVLVTFQILSSHQALFIHILASQANVETYIHSKGGMYRQHHILPQERASYHAVTSNQASLYMRQV